MRTSETCVAGSTRFRRTTGVVDLGLLEFAQTAGWQLGRFASLKERDEEDTFDFHSTSFCNKVYENVSVMCTCVARARVTIYFTERAFAQNYTKTLLS